MLNKQKRTGLYKSQTTTITMRVPVKDAAVIKKKFLAILRQYETGKIKRKKPATKQA